MPGTELGILHSDTFSGKWKQGDLGGGGRRGEGEKMELVLVVLVSSGKVERRSCLVLSFSQILRSDGYFLRTDIVTR